MFTFMDALNPKQRELANAITDMVKAHALTDENMSLGDVCAVLSYLTTHAGVEFEDATIQETCIGEDDDDGAGEEWKKGGAR